MISGQVKALRKALNLTQTEFGNSLGVSRDVIGNIEYDRVEPSDLIINMMCAKFDVDEHWLRTGEGEMFRKKTREEEIADWAASLYDPGNEFKRRLVHALSRLDGTGWQVVEHFVQMLYEEQLAENEQNKKDEGN